MALLVECGGAAKMEVVAKALLEEGVGSVGRMRRRWRKQRERMHGEGAASASLVGHRGDSEGLARGVANRERAQMGRLQTGGRSQWTGAKGRWQTSRRSRGPVDRAQARQDR
jgi:hypothetical protein